MSSLDRYLAMMTPQSLWPAARDAASARTKLQDVEDMGADVLVWKSNGHNPMDDMLAAWVTVGCITMEQALATSAAHEMATEKFLRMYASQQPAEASAEERAEMRAAFGPGAEVVDMVSGRKTVT